MEEKVLTLKERMEALRGVYDITLPKKRYVMAMIDGRSFSSLIKKRFKLPFDDTFINMMNETAKYVCERVSGCKFAYVQSDEITFVLTDFEDETTEPFFGNRLCKLQSIIPSMATAKFNRMLFENILDTPCSREDMIEMLNDAPMPTFDCKVWSADNFNDVMAYYIWRQNDCVRNSILQTAQSFFSKKEVLNIKCDGLIEKLKNEKHIDWNDFDNGVKYGRFIYKVKNIKYVEAIHKEIERSSWEVFGAFRINDDMERFKSLDVIPFI